MYNKVLHLDADVFVNGDIEEIFNIKEVVGWRKIIAVEPQKVFADIKRKEDYISAGNGGVLFFSSEISKYNIEIEDIINAFEKIKGLKRCGIDERILAYLIYEKGIVVKELDVIYNAPIQMCSPETISSIKIIHFLPFSGVVTKPWKNLVSYLYFDGWKRNYDCWLALGGDGPVNFTKEDYFHLFSFEEAILIKKLKVIVGKF